MNIKEEIVSSVKRYTKDLFSYAFAKVQQKELAEDLVQDTFLSAYKAYGNFNAKSNVKTWLFSILRHKIADYYRSKYKNGMEVSSEAIEQFFDENHRWKPAYRPVDWGNEKQLMDDPEFTKALKSCFDQLPQKWSAAMQLKYLEETNSQEICA